jgi:hypothetical protein
MAGPTRLELATSGVTGQRSNQLNYDPATTYPNRVYRAPTITYQQPIIDYRLPITHYRLLVGGTGFEPVAAGV